MRAGSTEWEIDVVISREEARQLKESPLIGTITRYRIDGNKPFDETPIPLAIQRGETSKMNQCIDFATTPSEVHWEKATAYTLIISDFAYSQIEERGATGERIYGHSACKIRIMVK
jgi:hypothetical protein